MFFGVFDVNFSLILFSVFCDDVELKKGTENLISPPASSSTPKSNGKCSSSAISYSKYRCNNAVPWLVDEGTEHEKKIVLSSLCTTAK